MRRILGIRTIPWVFGEERRIKKLWCVLLMFCVFCVFKKEKKHVKITRQRAQLRKWMVFLCLKGAWAFYSPSANFNLKLPLIGLILKPLERFWLLVSEKVWILKIQQSDQKLWVSEVRGASISALSWFFWYLDRLNSDFDPWIVFGMRIW